MGPNSNKTSSGFNQFLRLIGKTFKCDNRTNHQQSNHRQGDL